MNNQRIQFFSGIALQILNTFVYFVFRIISEFGRGAKHPISHAIISAILFYAAYHWLCTIYKEYQKLNSLSSEFIVSHIISLTLSDILLWVEAWQTWPEGNAPLVTLILIPLLFQSVIAVLYSILIVPGFRKQLIKEDAVIITGLKKGCEGKSFSDEPDQRAASFYTQLLQRYSDSIHVTEIVSENEPASELYRKIDKSSIVFLYGVSYGKREEFTDYCTARKKTLYFTPDLDDMAILGARPVWLTDTVLLMRDYSYSQGSSKIIKRMADIIVSLILLVVFSPLMLIITGAILAEDGGPVIFRQNRYTKDGRVFEILKFRTMEKQSHSSGVHPYTENDSRVTATGAVLRRLHLDELPQLVNILKGDMSLVGPRPEQVELADLYVTELNEYPERLRVRAGLTGLAQVYGKYSIEPDDKLQMDMLYIENQSLLLDLKILMLTAVSIFRKESTEGFDPERSNTIHESISEAEKHDVPEMTGAEKPASAAENVKAAEIKDSVIRRRNLAERVVRWSTYALILLFCVNDLSCRISWSDGMDTARSFYYSSWTVLQYAAYTLVLFLLVWHVIDTVNRHKAGGDLRKHSISEVLLHPMICFLITAITGSVIVRVTDGSDVLTTFLLVLLAWFASDETIAKILLCFFSFGIVFTVATYLLKLSEDIIFTFSYGICHSYGFNNPNSFGFYMLLSFLFGWYLYGNRSKWRFFLIGISASVICFLACGCRTVVILILCLTIYNTWLKGLKVQISKRTYRTFVTLLPVIMFALSVLAGITLYPIDDKIHSNFIVRVVDCVYAYKEKGLSLFPQSFDDLKRRYYFDNGYFQWIFTKGILASVGLLAPVILANYLTSARKKRRIAVLLFCGALYFCMENSRRILLVLIVASGGLIRELCFEHGNDEQNYYS